MKKFIFILICFCFLTGQLSLIAQEKSSGVLIYTKIKDMHASIKEEKYKAIVPQFYECQILFSYSKDYARTEERIEETDGPTIRAKGLSNNAIYDFKDKQFYNFVESPTMGNFMVTGDLVKEKVEITAEVKEILGYKCRKAVIKTTDKHIEIWYTDQIPVQISPMGNWGIPGAAMEINGISSHTTYAITSVEFKVIDNSFFEIPEEINKKYRKISFEKFDDLIKSSSTKGVTKIEK